MKIRYVSLKTVFPVPETWGCTDGQAIARARSLLYQRLEDDPASLMFNVETMDVADIKINRQPPAYWCDKFGVVILDPDGWDRTDPHCMEHPLSQAEFIAKYILSTCRVKDYAKYKVYNHLFH